MASTNTYFCHVGPRTRTYTLVYAQAAALPLGLKKRMTRALDQLRSTKTIMLTTFKRDGSPVETPVSIAFEGDRAFFRTWNSAHRVNRIAANPRVEIAPCSFRGTVEGASLEARAQLLAGTDEAVARAALAGRHRFLQARLVPLAHRLMRYRTLHYQLVAAEDDQAERQ
jgi:uncharacterized protein